MITAKVSSKGQIVIPKSVRDQLHLDAGTQLMIDVQGEAMVMRRLESDLPDWRTMKGMLKGGDNMQDLTQDLLDERASEYAREEERIEHWCR